jgi:hypothetical protein
MNVSAHEFGHILGIDDMYNMTNPPFPDSIMNMNYVINEDVEMALNAFITTQWQTW